MAIGSGWFCYPGKLKHPRATRAAAAATAGSGWFCYPGKLKREVQGGLRARLVRFRMVLLSGEVETERLSHELREIGHRSGWFCYPGKLKHWSELAEVPADTAVPDGFAIRGS